MEDTLKEIVKAAPAYAGLIIVVFLFLRHLKEVTAQHTNRTNEFMSVVRDVANENRESRNRTNEVIDKNTAAMASIETLLADIVHNGRNRGH